MTSKELLEKELQEPTTYIERNGVYYEVPVWVEKDLELLENIKNILDNSFNKTYEKTMNDIYGAFNKYYNEKARLENDK